MHHKINLTLKSFYEDLFKKTYRKSISDIETFLSEIQLLLLAMKNTPNMKVMLPKIISL